MVEDLRTLVPLAPLHQPYNLAAIEAVFERLPGVPQVACFDTSFHRGQPAGRRRSFRCRARSATSGVQRYGFHGLSYEYIASVLPKVAPEIAAGRVIVAHLGSGASLCALRSGKSIDSTLGFTALDGLCMGTRPGAVDPGVILYLFQDLELSAKDVETILYKKSGLLGISGISNDMRDLLTSTEASAPAGRRLLRLPRGAGDRRASPPCWAASTRSSSPPASARTLPRSAAASAARRRGSASTSTRRPTRRTRPRFSRPGSRVSAWVIPTNEELMIARTPSSLLGLVEARA